MAAETVTPEAVNFMATNGRGLICLAMTGDTMARVPDLVGFCKKHDLVMITVAEPARYRFGLDYEGSLGAFEGIFPVCPRGSADAFGPVLNSAVMSVNAERPI